MFLKASSHDTVYTASYKGMESWGPGLTAMAIINQNVGVLLTLLHDGNPFVRKVRGWSH